MSKAQNTAMTIDELLALLQEKKAIFGGDAQVIMLEDVKTGQAYSPALQSTVCLNEEIENARFGTTHIYGGDAEDPVWINGLRARNYPNARAGVLLF